jgi:DNA-binding MarR family transcriptional regulator
MGAKSRARAGPASPPDPALVDIERAMVRIRRAINRGVFAERLKQALGPSFDAGLAAVLDAIEQQVEAQGWVTVGVIAEQLGVDQSRASRLVSGGVGAGAIQRVASQGDGRRVELALTAAGERQLADVHRLRRAFANDLMAGWPASDRAQFARLIKAFVNAL